MIGRLLLVGGVEVKVAVDGLLRQASLNGSRNEVIGCILCTHIIEWIFIACMNALE